MVEDNLSVQQDPLVTMKHNYTWSVVDEVDDTHDGGEHRRVPYKDAAEVGDTAEGTPLV